MSEWVNDRLTDIDGLTGRHTDCDTDTLRPPRLTPPVSSACAVPKLVVGSGLIAAEDQLVHVRVWLTPRPPNTGFEVDVPKGVTQAALKTGRWISLAILLNTPGMQQRAAQNRNIWAAGASFTLHIAVERTNVVVEGRSCYLGIFAALVSWIENRVPDGHYAASGEVRWHPHAALLLLSGQALTSPVSLLVDHADFAHWSPLGTIKNLGKKAATFRKYVPGKGGGYFLLAPRPTDDEGKPPPKNAKFLRLVWKALDLILKAPGTGSRKAD
jgi:hypothetical protein